ncbi:hypothetical protein EV356DRAFT_572590 [Viridothelium virens]|uniref:Uncharacterized protein n=1 Tax=Viridothelium virens TaxID=1048519 RepID=A0A6A6HLS3_VIRVR|nr:hypothetical protein EV356DRAFT_572590 [Viridothelium virens]
MDSDPLPQRPFRIFHAFLFAGTDALSRTKVVCVQTIQTYFLTLFALPGITSAAYVRTDTSAPGSLFTPVPESSLPHNQQQDMNNSIDGETGNLNIYWWGQRGVSIRSGTDIECLGNLSLALMDLHALNAAEYSGAAGALALLPAAGALIGSPSKEFWMVYKLIPLAGVLSVFLSLGGTIIPSSASDYSISSPFMFGGMISSQWANEKEEKFRAETDTIQNLFDHQRFAQRVERRSRVTSGGNSYTKIWIALLVQLSMLCVTLVALWYGQIGGVIAWWCRTRLWMYFWYMLIIITSAMENWASVPFTDSWTMRVSRMPRNVTVSEDAPKVRASSDHDVLDNIKGGYNVKGRIIADHSPYTQDRCCFYVVVSKEGITPIHAAFQIIAKLSSVAVFAFGTALFASAQFMSITIVLMVLSLVLSAALLGRFTGMFIAAEMNRFNQPIIHAVVKTKEAAAEHVDAVLQISQLVIELEGHVIVGGRAVARRTQWKCLSTYIGLLARPFDIMSLAVRPETSNSRTSSMNLLPDSHAHGLGGNDRQG